MAFLDLILDHEANLLSNDFCGCQNLNARRTTQCEDCMLYVATCTDCFIASHANLPTHWAKVWDTHGGFFIRHDIAALRSDVCSLYLGHSGKPCPSKYASNLMFCIVDTNGIHNTRIRFCACHGIPNRAEQLMRAQVFPASVNQPTTAFTFQVLRQFHLYHLESKESVHDFVGALRRLTDNTFPQTVPVCCSPIINLATY